MAKRARVIYRDVPTPPPPPSGFSIDRVLSLTATPVIAAGLALVGFYFTTTVKLEQQADQIKQASAKADMISKQVESKTSDDALAREKIREAFLAQQNETNRGIAKLDTRLAVAEEQQKASVTQLTKISETLEKISNFALSGAAASKR